MDVLTASVRASEEGRTQLAVAIIPATAPGLERQPFWTNWVLAGAESHEVVLNDVEVESDLLIVAGPMDDERLGDLELAGLIWFELLVTASYLGVASALAERAIAKGSREAAEVAALGIDLEGSMMALRGVAYELEAEGASEALLARLLMTRYLAQGEAVGAAGRVMEMLGGVAFMRSSECTYLAAATRALAFHSPSRARTTAALVAFLGGERLRIE